METRNFVPYNEIAILEITFSEQEVQVCDREGTIKAIRVYDIDSPIARLVDLLRMLTQGPQYSDTEFEV